MSILKKKGILLLSIILLVLLGLGILGYNIVRGVYLDYYKDIDVVKKEDTFKNTDVILPEVDGQDLSEYYAEESIFEKAQKADGIYNILLVGMDARSYEDNSRSDTIILVSYNTNTQKITLMSFMRDSWVYLPDRGWGRINSATAFGGIGLLINTINENFDLDVQYYAQIRFEDFKKVIDIIGGIDIELDEEEIEYINKKLHSDDNDWNNDITSKSGLVHLNGTQTLWHCRNRSIGNNDFSRTERQRDVLEKLIENGKNLAGGELVFLLYQMKDYVNMNIPIDLLISLSKSALISGDLEITTYQVPFDGLFKFANKSGASVIELYTYETAVKIHELLGLNVKDISVISENITNYVSQFQNKSSIQESSNTIIEVQKNIDSIEDDTEIIEDNCGNVESNTEFIENNTENIEYNADNVESNTEFIENIEDNVESNTEFIENIEDNVESNTDNVESNAEFIEDNTENIEINTESIEDSGENMKIK